VNRAAQAASPSSAQNAKSSGQPQQQVSSGTAKPSAADILKQALAPQVPSQQTPVGKLETDNNQLYSKEFLLQFYAPSLPIHPGADLTLGATLDPVSDTLPPMANLPLTDLEKKLFSSSINPENKKSHYRNAQGASSGDSHPHSHSHRGARGGHRGMSLVVIRTH
jgi:hypothetical protein